MKVSREEFLGVDEPLQSNFESVAAKMALDFEADVFMRLKELGMKRKDLAKLLGVSPAAVSKTLTAGSNMTLKTMAKIATALGCDISPIRLNSVSGVSYVDLGMEGETDTVAVPNKVVPALRFSDLIKNETPAPDNTQVADGSRSVPAVGFRRVAA